MLIGGLASKFRANHPTAPTIDMAYEVDFINKRSSRSSTDVYHVDEILSNRAVYEDKSAFLRNEIHRRIRQNEDSTQPLTWIKIKYALGSRIFTTFHVCAHQAKFTPP